jgi:hypothetical protein
MEDMPAPKPRSQDGGAAAEDAPRPIAGDAVTKFTLPAPDKPARKPALTVVLLCIATVCAVGGYLLTTLPGWLWLVAVPLFAVSVALVVYALLMRFVTCPHCSERVIVMSRSGTHICVSCERRFTTSRS